MDIRRKHRSDCEHVYVIRTSRILSPDRTAAGPDCWLSERHETRKCMRSVNDWKGSGSSFSQVQVLQQLNDAQDSTRGRGRSGHATNLRSHFVIGPRRAPPIGFVVDSSGLSFSQTNEN